MPDDKPPILEDLIALEQDARALGFTWPDHAMIHQQLVSECEEVKQAMNNLHLPFLRCCSPKGNPAFLYPKPPLP